MKTLSNTHTSGQKKVPLIEIKGAREHNLKDLSLSIPRNQFIVITGPSGSGKSTLAFDTLYSEGQRRYIESLSAYARQFVEQLKKPEVESIKGLCPSIAIQQKAISKNPRSTVGTLTEIYDYLRLLYSRVGKAHCPDCNTPISSQTREQILDQILSIPQNSRLNIMAVIAQNKKGEFAQELNDLARAGIVRARIDGADVSIEKGMKLEKLKPHTIEAYVDRLIMTKKSEERIIEAIEITNSLTDGKIQIEIIDKNKKLLFNEKMSCPSCGKGFPELTPRLFSFNSPMGACQTCKGLGYIRHGEEEDDEEFIREECADCKGSRLRPEAQSVLIEGLNISNISERSIEENEIFFKKLKFTGNAAIIADKILKEIKERLSFLTEVGLYYLSLSRMAATLSGGEEQRVRLATQIGAHLTGVLYVLDEPSIGLHQVDNHRLLGALKRLRDTGNSVIVVEHDEETMREADQIIDLGPGAGRLGGFLVDQAPPKKLVKGPTADYLKGRKKIEVPKKRRKNNSRTIKIEKANLHNLKNIDVEFPIGVFSVVTGVSGSGKSSLILDVLSETIKNQTPIGCKRIHGLKEIDKLIRVDQSPIGRTPRSNPATYIGVFSLIREFFTTTPEARVRGYKPGRFSFNVEGGRCEECKGAGVLDIEMHFLPNVSVPCETCGERRYNTETLDITFKGRNIYEVLEMTFNEAAEFFSAIPKLKSRLELMNEVGLGYLTLGQPATTLSGGEAQRVKLAKELVKRSTGKTLYILDEPTTGLHFVDIEKLLHVVHRLVNLGNTVIIIEHHLDLIKSADHIIDLGPGGGVHGGKIIAKGSPEQIAKVASSHTGQFLKSLI